MKIQNPFRVALVATLGVGLGVVLLEGFSTLSTILLYIGTALFLSLGLEPVISWLTRHKFKRWLAVILTMIAVLAAFAGIITIVLPTLIAQVTQLIDQVSRIITRPTLINDIKNWLLNVFPNLDVDLIIKETQEFLLRNFGNITESVIGVGLATFNGLFGAFIVLILTIYFTTSTPSLKRSVYQLVPASKRRRFIGLSEQITASVGYYVMGQVSLGLINGIISIIFLSIIGAPFPAVLAVIAFFFSLIPLVGTLTGSTIIVLVCLIPGLSSPTTALVAAIWYLIYMQIEAYILSPRIMSRAVSVPGAVIVVAALAGGALLGLLGALIAIPVAASCLIIYRQVIIPRQNRL